ncbi:MAG: hypothetical protein HUU50_19960 [Candidatus Brocadiae bacterium]|nr:hypothetical protein [Candidatus Brocadiia bacterium]
MLSSLFFPNNINNEFYDNKKHGERQEKDSFYTIKVINIEMEEFLG